MSRSRVQTQKQVSSMKPPMRPMSGKIGGVGGPTATVGTASTNYQRNMMAANSRSTKNMAVADLHRVGSNKTNNNN